MDNTFRTIARTLQPYISDTYDLLNATDAVMQATFSLFPDKDSLRVNACTPELIRFATTNKNIVGLMSREGNKILAIKELRTLTGCGLKASKDAVESDEMSIAMLRYKLTGEIK